MDLGKDIEDSFIEEKMAAQKPNQCATLVYTVRNSLLQLMSCFTLLVWLCTKMFRFLVINN